MNQLLPAFPSASALPEWASGEWTCSVSFLSLALYLSQNTFKSFLFIWKRERERQREIIHPLGHSPNGCNSQELVPSLQHSWQGSKYVGIFPCLPRNISRKLIWKQSSPDPNLCSDMKCWLAGTSFANYTTKQTPKVIFECSLCVHKQNIYKDSI